MEHVHISTLIRERDQRGQERVNEFNLKVLPAVVLNNDKVVAIVAAQLLQTVDLILPVYPQARKRWSAVYVDVLWPTVSMYQTKHANNL